MSFEVFKNSTPAQEMVRDLIGLDMQPLTGWRDYTRAVAHAERNQAFVAKARELGTTTSTGEYAVLLAVLFSMDYLWLADEIEAERKTSFLSAASKALGEHAGAVAAALAIGQRA